MGGQRPDQGLGSGVLLYGKPGASHGAPAVHQGAPSPPNTCGWALRGWELQDYGTGEQKGLGGEGMGGSLEVSAIALFLFAATRWLS